MRWIIVIGPFHYEVQRVVACPTDYGELVVIFSDLAYISERGSRPE